MKNAREVELVTVSMVIKNIRYKQYDSRWKNEFLE